jgi:hypothetical protein
MGKRRHFTDFTAASCWLCDQERGLLCHVHDPQLRKHLAAKDGYIGGEDADQPVEVNWTLPREPLEGTPS